MYNTNTKKFRRFYSMSIALLEFESVNKLLFTVFINIMQLKMIYHDVIHTFMHPYICTNINIIMNIHM